jgi:hypothetical protein
MLLVQVAYNLASNGPKPGAELHVSLLRGRVSCSTSTVGSQEGRLGLPAFSTGSWHQFRRFAATSIALPAGPGQQLTLCFQQAAYTLLGKVCIAETCA